MLKGLADAVQIRAKANLKRQCLSKMAWMRYLREDWGFVVSYKNGWSKWEKRKQKIESDQLLMKHGPVWPDYIYDS